MADNDSVNKEQATNDKSGPFWLGWNLMSDRSRWGEWLYKNINNPVPVGKLHFTMFYCKDNDKPWPEPMKAVWTGKPCGLGLLGKALVVLFDAPQFVHARFTQLSADYQHSFPSLVPHMSLSYDGTQYGGDLQGLYRNLTDSELPLTFNNESIDTPDDPTDQSSYMDVMSSIYPTPHEKSPFEIMFRRACDKVPDIASQYVTGGPAYKKSLVDVISYMETERPRRG